MKMVWDQTAEKIYEAGIEQVGLFPMAAGAYPKGVPWNGVTALNITPSGAEVTPLYANNRKYGVTVSKEEVGGTIESYTFPDEWAECDGSASAMEGMYIAQQPRKHFGLVAKTLIGNDTEGTKHGYKLHILYDCLASPSEQANATINENVEAKTMSWEFSTTPVDVEGYEPASYIWFDSTKVAAEKLRALEAILYGKNPTTENGNDGAEPRLPLPVEVFTIMGVGAAG